ncbi:MAG: divergent polysaccharide deacetylase family protein [Fidelibacterota bacterium]
MWIWILGILVIVLSISQLLTLKKLSQQPPVSEPVKTGEAPSPTKVPGKLVLIIDDFGYRDDAVSSGFLALKVPLTCAIIPGHTFSQSFAGKAVQAGKEVIVHMPMESIVMTRGEDQFMLRTKMTSAEIEQRIQAVFDYLPEAKGMNNHQGSLATADGKLMAVVGTVLKRGNKFFIDSRTTVSTVAEQTMRNLAVPTIRRHVFLDNDADPNIIREQLQELAQIARKEGVAVGVGHAKQLTLDILKAEIPRYLEQGFIFEFASQAVY